MSNQDKGAGRSDVLDDPRGAGAPSGHGYWSCKQPPGGCWCPPAMRPACSSGVWVDASEATGPREPEPLPRYGTNQVFLREPQSTEALRQIKRTCEVALEQGALSKRNALIEIEDIARRAVAP